MRKFIAIALAGLMTLSATTPISAKTPDNWPNDMKCFPKGCTNR